MINRPIQTEGEPGGHADRRARRFGLRAVLQIGIGIGALALLVVKSDTRALIEALKLTRTSYLPLAVLASITVTWLMAYRWRAILAVRGPRLRTGGLFMYYLIGIFFMNFVPGGGVSGDVARLIYVDRVVRDKPFVLSTLVYERLVGLFVLLLIGLGATVASRSMRPEGRFIYFAEGALALGFLATAALMSEFATSRAARLIRVLAKRVRMERLGDAASRTLEAISELRKHRGMILTTILVSVIIRVVWSLGCYVVALAMGLPLSMLVVFAFISIVDLVRMLPISIGGIGVREWVLVALFANVGLAREQALMFSFLAFAPVLLNAIAGGLIYISRAGILTSDKGLKSREAIRSNT
jgi:uncharacterized protein (TIRG00374 family)